MQNIIKSLLVWGIILSCIIGSWGCKGGKIPELGDISGPATVDEYGYVEYSVSFVNATGATFLWSCDPADAGQFDKYDSPKTGFTASMVTHDTPIKIILVVESEQFYPVILSRNITIRDMTKLAVGEIEGPDFIDEGSSVTYSVTATDDTGIKYQWSAIPDDFGIFDIPQQPATQFTAAYLDEDTPLEIQVNIESDNYGPILMKKAITITDKGPYGWARTWGGSFSDWPGGVAVDGSSNIYVTGGFQEIVDFDPGPGIDEHTSNGDYDIFLAKFDSNGEFQWARTWGDALDDDAYGVAVDGSGNAIVTGYFHNTVDFDPGPGVNEHTSIGSYDIFLSKFDPNGEFQWARTWGGKSNDLSYEVAIDGFGNAFVTGFFLSTVDFDPGPGVDDHTSNGMLDIFLSKFDSNGEFQWACTWGGNNCDLGYEVTIDGSGNPYIVGIFSGTVDFNPGPGVEVHTSNVGWDNFLCKFDPNGEFQWVRTWGGSHYDYAYGIAVDGCGNAYVTGEFKKTVDFDPGPGVDEQTSNGDGDIFLIKFDLSGEFQWARTWGGIFRDYGSAVTADGSGNIYVSGRFINTVDFNPGPGVEERNSNGLGDIFLSKFDSNGDFQWARTWGGSDYDSGYGVAIDGYGNTYVTGLFSLTVDFDPGPGVDEHTSNGDWDIFLSKFPPDGNW